MGSDLENARDTSAPRPKRRILKRVLKTLAVLVVVLGAVGGYLYATQRTHHSAATKAPAPVAASNDPMLDAIRRGCEYLKVHQEGDHEFSAGLLDPKPAVTALVVDAIANSPDGSRYESDEFVRQACTAILSHQQEDGGIYTPGIGLANYCTSISIMALSSVDAARFSKEIERATAYIRTCQLGVESGDQAGGFGYGGSGGNADLSNTVQSLEALRQAGVSPDDPAMKRAVEFINRCQNRTESNPAPWAMNDGGFIYRPGVTRAKEVKKPDGTVGYESYGLMSYAGLLSFLHANVAKDDPRVVSAVAWIRGHYTFEENVNLGDHGRYYCYVVMSKALSAYGERRLKDDRGEEHDWPVELAECAEGLQRADGSWCNEKSDRWMEGDSVLVTAYMVRALSTCWRVVHGPGAAPPPASK